ncbi:MAG: hypothetical protein KDD35_08000 [Bdellovibrionales bacterium]|nr:hypothetical protein [Bdellovibrionales bacterium]
MRSPIYRNLDKPFQIMGFSALELALLCICLVVGGEIVEFLGQPRILAMAFTFVLGCLLIWVRRSLGDFFLGRLIRFVVLPREIYSKIKLKVEEF